MKKVIYLIGIIAIISITIFLSTGIDKKIGTNPFEKGTFEWTKKEFDSGNYSVVTDIPKEYYTKFEFYPWSERCKGEIERKAMYGYGAYPADVTYEIQKFEEGQHIDVYAFVFSSCGVGSYQGIGLYVKNPDNKSFDVLIDPSNILLYPVPINSSDNQNWTYKIKMEIIARKDIPKGKYVFNLKAGLPSEENRTENYKLVGNNRYVEGSPIQPSKFFDIILYTDN